MVYYITWSGFLPKFGCQHYVKYVEKFRQRSDFENFEALAFAVIFFIVFVGFFLLC